MGQTVTDQIQEIVRSIQKHGISGRSTWESAASWLGFEATTVGLVALALVFLASIPVAVQVTGDQRTAADRLGEVGKALDSAELPDASSAQVVEALRQAAAGMEALAVEPRREDSSPAPARAPSLSVELRTELKQAAATLAALTTDGATTSSRASLAAARAERGVGREALRVLLDRVRAGLAGEVALGLTFQGSYSQGRVKEPAYGGHASAMGPAPAPLPAAAGGASSSPATFEERVQLATRTFAGGPTKEHILESAGNGVALLDFDGDGWLDIYLVTAAQLTTTRERVPHRNALYRNRGNWTFEDVSAKAGVDLAAWGNGVCAGDADGDGRLDLYVTNWGPNVLFRNRGDGTFEDIASRAGVAAGGWSTGCTFFDADNDGDLDLYVARYVETTWDEVVRARRTLVWRNGPKIMVGPAGLPGEADLFFENLGDGRFRDATAARGLADAARAYGFGVVSTDIDDDGCVDVFVANDSNPNFLYRNRCDGHFDSVGLLAGVAVNGEARAQAGMGVDAGDVDGDGRMDLVLTAFAHDRDTLYRNLDGQLFEDASLAVGLGAPTFERMGWGVAFLDADLDGRLDLFVANGHIFADVGNYPELGETFAQKNLFLINAGGTFRDVSAMAGAGLQVQKVSRGLAVGDLDNDGDPDVVISNMDDTPTVLENRQRTGHHWVGVRLTSASGNRFAIGARVTVTSATGSRQVREIRSGGSYMSQGDLRALVGAGSDAGPVTVDVRMPGGDRFRWTGLAVDRHHTLSLDATARMSGARAPR